MSWTSRSCSSLRRRTTRKSASLADVLEVLVKKWPEQFTASNVAGMINNPYPNEDEQTLREYLLPGALPNHVFSAKSIGKRLKQHADGWAVVRGTLKPANVSDAGHATAATKIRTSFAATWAGVRAARRA